MPSTRLLGLPALALVVVAACGSGSGAASAPAASTGSGGPTPVVPSASPVTSDSTYSMRLTTWQAIPPINLFSVPDTSVVDGAGVAVLPGVVPAIYPGPLVVPWFGRQVSEAGQAQIVSWARDLGLLGGDTDFTGNGTMPGGMTGRIELMVDGDRVTLTGIPPDGQVIADPAPGSPEAFQELWRRLADLPGSLGAELGQELPYTPAGYALLVGPPPQPEAGMAAQVMTWPLATPITEFGSPVANGTARCGLATGEDGTAMGAALAQANQLTQWVQDPETNATFGLTVRPIVAGEDPCAEVFGVE